MVLKVTVQKDIFGSRFFVALVFARVTLYITLDRSITKHLLADGFPGSERSDGTSLFTPS